MAPSVSLFIALPLVPPTGAGVMPMKRVWTTVVSQDAYLPGVLVLAHCLETVKTKYPFIVLATPSLSQQARTLLTRVQIPYLERTGLYPSVEQHDPRITDDRYEEVWTKLRCGGFV
jgi:hypothetical protein